MHEDDEVLTPEREAGILDRITAQHDHPDEAA